MSQGLQRDRAAGAKAVPPRTMASLVQAILHGLSVQLVADPAAFDRAEMLQLCTDLLGSYLHAPTARPAPRPKRRAKLSG